MAEVHRHLAGDNEVDESVEYPHRLIGDRREIDVVIKAQVAGQEVLVAVEATKLGQKATQPWVEQQIAKHKELPTNKLILVAERGFYNSANRLAVAYGAVPITAEDLEGGDLTFKIVNNLESLWMKFFSMTPTAGTMQIEAPKLGPVVELINPPLDLDIFTAGAIV